ncbi:DNA replication licensing factor MCM7 like protein [Argiope bruennichi]|uniref:DNA replication licensing factor MCM7 like protein n=1 Tax=Argiope bruennichi TaxID=94029 RepID=A0A8T0FJP1_ARGBR|nr:DNA replication licensing factor MCM7 like protein [Argiope bruennichi]
MDFLSGFITKDPSGGKLLKYGTQLTKLAQREQVMMTVDLDDVAVMFEDLCEAILQNARRYSALFADVIQEMLPNYKIRDVAAKDVLDVYIQHRLKMDAMSHTDGEYRDPKNKYPAELLRRFEIYFKNKSDADQLSKANACGFNLHL